MVFRGAGAALLLLTGAAYREGPSAEDLADFKSDKELAPETDKNILDRITNVEYQGGADALLPDLVPHISEKVLGYYFAITQRCHGKQSWFVTGMRVTRGLGVADDVNVELAKPIHVANMVWATDAESKHKMFVIKAAKSNKELLRVRQEAKGKHLFRILPPGSNLEADTLYQFKTKDNALYSDSFATAHEWQVYRGKETENEYLHVSCTEKDCSFDKRGSDGKEIFMGFTTQQSKSDPDHVITRREIDYKHTRVEVMWDQDSALMLTIASTVIHKYKGVKSGVFNKGGVVHCLG